MPKITQKEAKKWLENISSKDRVAIIHHDDGDGFCSGILYYEWCKQKKAKVKQFTYELRATKLRKLKLEKFNKIIFTDLASPILFPDIEENSHLLKDKDIFYCDHHPQETNVPKFIKALITTPMGYIPSSRTAGEITGLRPWLALSGTISDAANLYPENKKYIDKHLKEVGMSLEEFRQNVSSKITNTTTYFKKNHKKAFNEIKKIKSIDKIKKLDKYSEAIEKEVSMYIDEYESKREKLGDISYYYVDPKHPVKSIVASIISRNHPKDTIVFATPKGKSGKIAISARNDSGGKSMPSLLKSGVEKLDGGSAGGHERAAGGSIFEKDLEKFKQNIRNFDKK